MDGGGGALGKFPAFRQQWGVGAHGPSGLSPGWGATFPCPPSAWPQGSLYPVLSSLWHYLPHLSWMSLVVEHAWLADLKSVSVSSLYLHWKSSISSDTLHIGANFGNPSCERALSFRFITRDETWWIPYFFNSSWKFWNSSLDPGMVSVFILCRTDQRDWIR